MLFVYNWLILDFKLRPHRNEHRKEIALRKMKVGKKAHEHMDIVRKIAKKNVTYKGKIFTLQAT